MSQTAIKARKTASERLVNIGEGKVLSGKHWKIKLNFQDDLVKNFLKTLVIITLKTCHRKNVHNASSFEIKS